MSTFARRLAALEKGRPIGTLNFSRLSETELLTLIDFHTRRMAGERVSDEDAAEAARLNALIVRKGLNPYTHLSDAELDAEISQIEKEFSRTERLGWRS